MESSARQGIRFHRLSRFLQFLTILFNAINHNNARYDIRKETKATFYNDERRISIVNIFSNIISLVV